MTTPAPVLVTLDEARKWLRLTHSLEDDTLAIVVAAATAAAWAYITEGDPAWTPTTAPGDVRAAILMQVEDLWTNRGAEEPDHEGNRIADGYLSPRISRLLYPFRKPTVQ